jgi:hypothetical protein
MTRNMKRLGAVIVAPLAALALLAAVGCGGDDDAEADTGGGKAATSGAGDAARARHAAP